MARLTPLEGEPAQSRLTPIEPEQSRLSPVSQEEVVSLDAADISTVSGNEFAERWGKLKNEDPTLPTFNEWLEQDAKSSEESLRSKAPRFLEGAKEGLTSIAGSIFRDSVNRAKTMIAGSPNEKFQLMKDDASAAAEGVARNLAGIGGAMVNLTGAIGDKFVSEEEEKIREFERFVNTSKVDNEINKGLLIDPSTIDADKLAFAEVASDPLNFVPGAGVALRTGRMGVAMQKIGNVPRATARKVLKAGAKVTEKTAGLTSKIATFGEKAGGEAVKRGLQAAPLAILAPASLPIVAKTVVGGAATKFASKGVKKVADKVEVAARVASSPDRQKRFLDVMHQEHGSKLAGVASRLGGTQVGDVLFNAVVDGTQAGLLNVAEANLAQRDARQVGEAFGAAAGFAGPLGGAVGERGAGASTRLVDAAGQQTSRSQGSFNLAAEQINARKSDALNQLDQSQKLQALPEEVKAALGQAQEMGVLPDDVVMLDPKDFQSAVGALKNTPNVSGEFNNAALFFPDDNVIFLNSDANMAGGDGLRIVGEELGHVMMNEVIKRDPSIVLAESQRFSDPSGKEIPMANGSSKSVKINKEMQNFVDAYNVEAEASGAPQIKTFDHALHEFYGAQAGIDMASNQSVFSPSMPLWAQKVVHASRERMLNMIGKQPRATADYARGIDQAANTPAGKYAREQYKIWQQESARLNSGINKALNTYTNPKDAKTPQEAYSALKDDPSVVGEPKIVPNIKKQTKLRDGDLQKAAKAAGIIPERGRYVIKGAIPEDVKNVWVEQFPKSQQAEARRWLDQIEADNLNREAMIFRYETRTGDRAAPGLKKRYGVAEGGFTITKGNEIQLNVRDMDAINANIQVAMNEGRTDGKSFEQIQSEVIADLEAFERDPSHQVSDQTRAIMGEKRNRDGKVLGGKWQGWDVPRRGERRPVKNFNIDGMVGYAQADGSSAFGQPRAQEGLVFANPRKVGGNSPKAKSAARKMGVTKDLNEAGYIMQDGQLLDFSGKRDGGMSGVRHMDHREIEFDGSDSMDGTDAMVDFMRDGNIRMSNEGGFLSFDGRFEVTPAQKSIIRRIVDQNDGALLDFEDKGEIVSIEVENPKKVIPLIDRWMRGESLESGQVF